MGLWDKIFGEFVDVIEWTDDTNDTMVYRFERYGNEIKYGAKLTVREGQVVVFVNEGEVADVLSPGMYELETKNLPVLSTLQHWDHGFESPFKAEVYFCNTRRFTDLKWGTKNPLILRDAEFGAVRLRAFGSYVVRIDDAAKFIREIVGTDGLFTLNEITNQLRNMIVSRLAAVIAPSGIPVLDMAANYDQFGEFLTDRIAPEFEVYGLELTKMLVENISLPADVETALDKRTSMGIVGDLDDYLKYQSADAVESSAENPAGGGASDALNMGMGIAVGQKMGESLNHPSPNASSPQDIPPPIPRGRQYYLALDNRPQGPFGIDEIRQKKTDSVLTAETLVWASGMKDWVAAGQVQDLQHLLRDETPPPLPDE